MAHSGHALANSARAAAERARLLRDACERARRVPDLVDHASRALAAQEIDVDVSYFLFLGVLFKSTGRQVKYATLRWPSYHMTLF